MIRTILTIACFCICPLGLVGEETAPDWRTDYAAAEGFRIDRDTTGYSLPTAIAFVPTPGPGDEDPLYFVTELRGTIKVVTNNRKVHVFARVENTVQPPREIPDTSGEVGMAGICLDAGRGYVFVSYVYADSEGYYRNAIIRFTCKPVTFALKPDRADDIGADLFEQHMSSASHQIGPMVIDEDSLFVSVGDANVPIDARNLDSPNGKVLRMQLDGLPAPGNPYAESSDPSMARNYVWAMGLRNPFSLASARGRLFLADNGPRIDRFVEVERGRDYLYEGGDAALGANSTFVWTPSVSPVQMQFDPQAATAAGFPSKWRERFFIALSGAPDSPPGPDPNTKAVVGVALDFETGQLQDLPAKFLRYVGPESQLFVGLGMGPDGLYAVPLLPDSEGVSAVLRVTYDPPAQHPQLLRDQLTVAGIMERRSCYHCHNIDGRGVGIGPDIFRKTISANLLERLESAAYVAQSREIDELQEEPYTSFRNARAEVRDARGHEKVRLWLKYRLLEPRFDQQIAVMPNLGLTEIESKMVSDWLLEFSPMEQKWHKWRSYLPEGNLRRPAAAFVIGGALGFLTSLIVFRKHRRRANSNR